MVRVHGLVGVLMLKILRWFGFVPKSEVVELKDAHEEEVKRLRSAHLISFEELRRSYLAVVEAAAVARRGVQRDRDEKVRVIGRLLEELAAK